MKLMRAMELIREFEECPDCGNRYVGAGEGAIEVTDDTFRRSCKCGFEVTIVEEQDEKEPVS